MPLTRLAPHGGCNWLKCRECFPLDRMTTAELRAYAREHYSALSNLTDRKQLILALTKAEEN